MKYQVQTWTNNTSCHTQTAPSLKDARKHVLSYAKRVSIPDDSRPYVCICPLDKAGEPIDAKTRTYQVK